MLVNSLAVDNEGSTPRNEEHSIPHEPFHPDPAPITMNEIERIVQQLNANMQYSLQELIVGITQLNQGAPREFTQIEPRFGMIPTLMLLTGTSNEWEERDPERLTLEGHRIQTLDGSSRRTVGVGCSRMLETYSATKEGWIAKRLTKWNKTILRPTKWGGKDLLSSPRRRGLKTKETREPPETRVPSWSTEGYLTS